MSGDETAGCINLPAACEDVVECVFEAASAVVVVVVVICMVATRTLPNAQSAMLPEELVLTRMSRDSELELLPLLLLPPPPPIVPLPSPPTHAWAAAVSVVGPVGPDAAAAADEGMPGAGCVKGGTAKKRVWR